MTPKRNYSEATEYLERLSNYWVSTKYIQAELLSSY